MQTEIATSCSLVSRLRRLAASRPSQPIFRRRSDAGQWTTITWGAAWAQVENVASFVRLLGLNPGDRLAIWARTSVEWQIAEWAGLACGLTVVGVDPHAAPENVERILTSSRAKALIVDEAQRLQTLPPGTWSGKTTLVIRDESAHDARQAAETDGPLYLWRDALNFGGARSAAYEPTADDPATLIYTSGATGRPKAILYTHGQILAATEAILESFPGLGAGENMLCWLPMAHLYQRMLNFFAAQRGAILCFVEDPHAIAACLRETNPEVFVGVPRVFEKIHDGIRNKVAAQIRPWRALFAWALKIGGESARRLRAGQTPSRMLSWQLRLADILVLRRIRGLFGKKIRFLVSGSAPLSPHLPEFFQALGLTMLEAYGVSENTVPLAANRPGAYRFGSVGKPFAANEIRLAADGEVLVRGPGLFNGYEGETDADEYFTADGFYKTGDLGRFDEDGYLWLKGRKAEIIKTSTGRKLAPFKIECAYRQSPLIAQIAVVGEGRERPAALVVLDETVLAQYWSLSGLPAAAAEEMRRSDFARELTKRELERCGAALAPHERVGGFALLEKPFAVETGELTPNLKLRRSFVADKYAQAIERCYAVASPRATRRRRPPPSSLRNLTERRFKLKTGKRESR